MKKAEIKNKLNREMWGRNISLVIGLLIFTCIVKSQTTVETHGLLKTKDNTIVDKNNETISLAGMSLFWSNWAGDYYNADLISWLQTDWDCKIVRAAMGIEGNSSGLGYLDSPETEKEKVKTVVDACIDEGIYVLIDWHDHNAEQHTNEASSFFAEMAQTYGEYENIIYEIFNEPLDISWSNKIKPYAEIVIDSIRKYDPDNLIIVGTRNWSQMVSEVIAAPISDVNVAYTLHFYVGMHGQWLRDEATKALNAGIPLFATEWGLWGDDSDMENWMQFLKDNKISHCNWSVNDKVEPSSALNIGASKQGGWTDSDLTQIGKEVRNYIIYWDSTYTPELPKPPCDTLAIPSKIEAEDYCDMSGIQTETCEEGGYNVGYIEAGDWLEYIVQSSISDTVTIQYRVAAESAAGEIELQIIDEETNISLHTVSFSSTGGWQAFTTINKKAYIPEGIYKIKLLAKKSGFNINWFTVMDGITSTDKSLNIDKINVYPNPATNTLFISSTSQNYAVEIFDLGGRKVYYAENISGKHEINLCELSNGVYTLNCIKDNSRQSKLFIKN